MGDIFISYKAEDRARVRPLADALEAEKLSLWWDVQIEGGAEWRHTIQEQLDAARCVIVMWSKRSVGREGRFVQDEASRALKRGIYLPVRIDRVEPPVGFGETQAYDLVGWKGSRGDPRFLAVLDAARAILAGQRRRPAPTPALAKGPDRRALLAGGAGLLAAGGGGAWWWHRYNRPLGNAIAVLPFQNLSSDPAQDYFSEGMSEELRDSLARIPGLQVAARISSDMFRDARDAATIAGKLGVSYVLDGSVRRAGNLIRVSAQLVTGATGFDRWSQSYDRAAGDALAIQSDIAGNVVSALEIALGSAGAAALALGGTRNADANDHYLKGRAILDSVASEAGLRTAWVDFAAATTIDPNYASAHAALGRTLAEISTSYATSRDAPSLYQAALASAHRAIALAPQLAQAYYVLGYVLTGRLHIAEASAPYERARLLGAGNAEILTGYAGFAARLGHAPQATSAIDRALLLDPLNPHVHAVKGSTLLAARRYSDGIAAYRETMRLSPKATFIHWSLGDCLYLQGKYAEAATEYAQETIPWARATGLAMAAWKRGDKAAADQSLAILRADGGADYQIADVLAQRGDRAGALDALERAWAARDAGLVSLKTDPMLDPLRGEPRFQALLEEIGFTGSTKRSI